MDWIFKTKESIELVTELPSDCVAFVYMITYESGMRYIGKKTTSSTKELPVLKGGKVRDGYIKTIRKRVYRDESSAIIVGKANIKKARKAGIVGHLESYDVIKTENKWRSYIGSSELIPKSDKIVEKRILALTSALKTATYLEHKYLFKVDAPMNKKYYNKVIGRSFYDNDLDGYIKYQGDKK
jgi:hypothetical protein